MAQFVWVAATSIIGLSAAIERLTRHKHQPGEICTALFCQRGER